MLMLYAYLLYRLFVIAQNAPDMFGSLMVSGIFIHIALQVILNIAVVVNLMPNTGVTLPFISYGGTSIVFLMAEMGLALSVARQIKSLRNKKCNKIVLDKQEGRIYTLNIKVINPDKTKSE